MATQLVNTSSPSRRVLKENRQDVNYYNLRSTLKTNFGSQKDLSCLKKPVESENSSESDGERDFKQSEVLITNAPRFVQNRRNSTPELSKEKSKGVSLIGIFSALALVAIIIGVLMNFLGKKDTKIEENTLKMFEDNFETLQNEFPNQSKKTWKKIVTMVKSVLLNKAPKSPGVISILSDSNTAEVANCLGRKLASLLKTTYNDSEYVKLNGRSFSNKNFDEAKLSMDDIIRKGLGNGQHIVLFENFHAISASCAMLFHGLCDNENAPFKNVHYIFILKKENGSDEITSTWRNVLDESIRYSLESRIGNNMVTVSYEVNMNQLKSC